MTEIPTRPPSQEKESDEVIDGSPIGPVGPTTTGGLPQAEADALIAGASQDLAVKIADWVWAEWCGPLTTGMPNRDEAIKQILALMPHSEADETLRTEGAASSTTAWLIEREGLCLGFCEHRLAWVTFTNDDALRFSRKRDAYSFMETMKWEPKWLRLEGATITEHGWEGESTTPDAARLALEEREAAKDREIARLVADSFTIEARIKEKYLEREAKLIADTLKSAAEHFESHSYSRMSDVREAILAVAPAQSGPNRTDNGLRDSNIAALVNQIESEDCVCGAGLQHRDEPTWEYCGVHKRTDALRNALIRVAVQPGG